MAVLNQLSLESKQAPKPSQRLIDLKQWNEFLEKTDFVTDYPQLFSSADKSIIDEFNATAKKDLSVVIQQFDTIKKFKAALETARGQNLEGLAAFFDKTLAPKRTKQATGTTTERVVIITQSPLNDATLATMLNNEYPETPGDLASTINSYIGVQRQYAPDPRNMLISLLDKAKTAALFDEPTRQKFDADSRQISAFQQPLLAVIAQKQSQATKLAATELDTIITTLNSRTAPLTALFSCLDRALALNYQQGDIPTTLKAAIPNGIARAITLITPDNYTTAQSKITGYITSVTSRYISESAAAPLRNSLATKIKSVRSLVIASLITTIQSFKTAVTTALAMQAYTPATVAQRQAKMTKLIKTAADIIDMHTQLAPSTTEFAQANLGDDYTSFNDSVIKLIQDQGFIEKTTSGKTDTYALAYNATAAEPKTSLTEVLNFMSTPPIFPQLTPDQKAIIDAIKSSIK